MTYNTHTTALIGVLRAAITHGRNNAHGPVNRRACAFLFLRAEEKVAIRKRDYWRAGLIRTLIHALRDGLPMASLLESLEGRPLSSEDGRRDPLSNTGPTDLRLCVDRDGGENVDTCGMSPHTPTGAAHHGK